MTGDHIDYIDFCRDRHRLSHHSLRAYEQDLTCYTRWEDAQKDGPIVDEDETLIRFHQHLRKEGVVSPATARRRIVTLKAFLKWRMKRDSKPMKSFADLELDLRLPRRLPRPVEREALIEVLSSSPHIVPRSDGLTSIAAGRPADQHLTTGLAIRLLIATGARIGELTGISIRCHIAQEWCATVRGDPDRRDFRRTPSGTRGSEVRSEGTKAHLAVSEWEDVRGRSLDQDI